MVDPYRIELADLEKDRSRILQFWERADFSTPDRAERYDWFHVRNPAGRGRIYLLLHGESGNLVGTACAGTRVMRTAGAGALTASVLIDFAVDPGHRSFGPAIKLQRAVRDRELRRADILYGLPDTKAVPIFKRLGSDALLSEGSYAYVVRSRKYLEKRAPGWAAPVMRLAAAGVDLVRANVLRLRVVVSGFRCEWSRSPPAGLDELWSHTSSQNRCIGVRDADFVAWRFEHPDWIFASVTNTQTGLAAYMACRKLGEEWLIGDLLLPAEDADRRHALRALLAEAWRTGARVVRIDLIAEPTVLESLRAVGFSLRGARPCFVVRNPSLPASAFPNNWWLTRADEDV